MPDNEVDVDQPVFVPPRRCRRCPRGRPVASKRPKISSRFVLICFSAAAAADDDDAAEVLHIFQFSTISVAILGQYTRSYIFWPVVIGVQ